MLEELFKIENDYSEDDKLYISDLNNFAKMVKQDIVNSDSSIEDCKKQIDYYEKSIKLHEESKEINEARISQVTRMHDVWKENRNKL